METCRTDSAKEPVSAVNLVSVPSLYSKGWFVWPYLTFGFPIASNTNPSTIISVHDWPHHVMLRRYKMKDCGWPIAPSD